MAKQGAEPAELRTPVRIMRAMLLDGEGFRKVTRERLGGVAGATHLAGIGKDKQAPEVVFFQRQGAGGATLDTFTVRRDGSGRLEKRYGGAGGRFKDLELRRGVLPKLRAALARLPRSGFSLTAGARLRAVPSTCCATAAGRSRRARAAWSPRRGPPCGSWTGSSTGSACGG